MGKRKEVAFEEKVSLVEEYLAGRLRMREVALILLDKLHSLIPVCFDDIWGEYHEQG